MEFCADLFKDDCGDHDQSLKTAKIGICTSLKLNIFRSVSETMTVEPTTFLSHVQNLVKIGKELWMQSFDNTWTHKQTKVIRH